MTPKPATYDLEGPNEPPPPAPGRRDVRDEIGERPPGRRGLGHWAWLAIWAVGLVHVGMIWVGVGGRSGLMGEWPMLASDHGIHYHHAVTSRHFLRESGTTAGYDPSFMAGYPMSVVSGLSTTLPDLVLLACGDRLGPAVAYKGLVFACSAAYPWLIATAAIAWGARAGSAFVAVLLAFLYYWTDTPWGYASWGMSTYLLSVPMGLVTVAALSGYLNRGGFGRWASAATWASAVFLVHVTSPMVVAPAGLLAYVVAVVRGRREGRRMAVSRHLGLWAMGPVILAANAFWWLPGYWLWATKGPSDYAFAHPESVLRRVVEIAWVEAPIEAVALALAMVGLAVMARRDAVGAAGLGGFLLAGFAWGYLAGGFRALDPLQPGRHTYACYAAACVAAGFGLAAMLAGLRSDRGGRLDRWAVAAALLLGVRMFGESMELAIRQNLTGPRPFLGSEPTPRMRWLVDRLKQHVKPGERLLFEETGFHVPGEPDPFEGRHLSPILPGLTGVEVIGGPYLHMTVTTNFTQFGEGKLFGLADWGLDHFRRYATLYRPSAIACRSPKARAFCRAHPDLIQVVEDDGTFLIGRVHGFDGAAIRGRATVEAGPNRLVVRDFDPGPDGLVVLRYHMAPCLVSDPPTPIEPVRLEADPVPFIGLRATSGGPITLRMAFPPRNGTGP